MSATSTAWSSTPPGLPRRSSISFFMPCFSSFVDGGGELAAGGVREVSQEDVAGVRRDHEGVGDRARRDLGARDRHPDRLVDARPADRDRHLRPLGAPQLADHLVGRGVFLDLLVLDVRDDVAGPDAELEGGRALHRRDDGDLAHPLLDLDAQAEEGALLLLPHRRVVVGLEEGRVRIQAREHAVDRRVDDLLGRDRLGRPVGERRQDVGVLVERRACRARGAAGSFSPSAPPTRVAATTRQMPMRMRERGWLK